LKHTSTQTDARRGVKSDHYSLIDLEKVAIIVDCMRNSVKDWNFLAERTFSVVIDMLLSYTKIGYTEMAEILSDLNCLDIKTTRRWSLTLIESDDPSIILNDKRGGYHLKQLYELLPELEIAAKEFAIRETAKKNCSFNVSSLAKFITKHFKELTGLELEKDDDIRSHSAIRLDLTRWGAKWKKNNKRPYFEGHEREDVLKEREKLVEFLVENKQRFYQQTYSGDLVEWIEPTEDEPYIILTHDECCVSSGEQQSHKWSFGFNSAFYNKNRGRSKMLSYFLCQHKYSGLFELSSEEWQEAITAYPELNNKEGQNFEFDENSANASMEPGKNKDGYFDNEAILKQFKRLFILLKYKTIFRNHKIMLFVDNARTHSAKKYDKNMLFKKKRN